MFRFEYSTYLWYIPVAVFALGLLYWLLIIWNRSRLKAMGNPEVLKKMLPQRNRSILIGRALLYAVALVSIILAIANPQYGNKKQTVQAESADIYIAFDISESMRAMDVAPSRLERAKRFTEDLITALRGNRIGLVYFAGSSYLQMPLTLDYSAVLAAIKTANPNYAGIQGTSISDAIRQALDAHQENDAKYRALIIISDGEDHEQEALEAAKEAREAGMTVYTIGVGTESGGFIPIKENGRELYKKDADGNPVRSKINVNLLRAIARSGGGAFYMVEQGGAAIEDLELRLSSLAKTEQSERSFDVKESYFQYFLALAFILLAVNWFLKRK